MTKVSALWAPPVPRRVLHFRPPLPEVGILTYPNELEKTQPALLRRPMNLRQPLFDFLGIVVLPQLPQRIRFVG
jgi:hypothetical protein